MKSTKLCAMVFGFIAALMPLSAQSAAQPAVSIVSSGVSKVAQAAKVFLALKPLERSATAVKKLQGATEKATNSFEGLKASLDSYNTNLAATKLLKDEEWLKQFIQNCQAEEKLAQGVKRKVLALHKELDPLLTQCIEGTPDEKLADALTCTAALPGAEILEVARLVGEIEKTAKALRTKAEKQLKAMVKPPPPKPKK